MFGEAKITRQTSGQLKRIGLRSRIGKFLNYFVSAHTGVDRINDTYRVWLARSPIDRLSEREINHYSGDLIFSVGDPDQAEYARSTSQGMSIPFVQKIIDSDPTVRSFLNVGVYIGNFDYLMAKANPNVEFLGVDFWKDLMEANAPLALPNFRVIRGYSLDLLEKGEISADIIHFCATATRMKEQELRRYMKAFAEKGKYVVFNEPLFPLPNGLIPDPTTTDASWPILTWPIYSGDKDSGYPPCLCHNYAKIASEYFDVIHQSVIHTPNPRVFVVAKAKA